MNSKTNNLFESYNTNLNESNKLDNQLKNLGILEIGASSEHKRADEDTLNKLQGHEFVTRLNDNPDNAQWYGYIYIRHKDLGDIFVSYNTNTNEIDTTGFPWKFIEEDTTSEQRKFVENNKEFLNNYIKSGEISKYKNLEESAKPEDLDKEHDNYYRTMNKKFKSFCNSLEVDPNDLDDVLSALDELEGQFGDDEGEYQELREFIYNELMESDNLQESNKTINEEESLKESIENYTYKDIEKMTIEKMIDVCAEAAEEADYSIYDILKELNEYGCLNTGSFRNMLEEWKEYFDDEDDDEDYDEDDEDNDE